jgi:hypothetical protein
MATRTLKMIEAKDSLAKARRGTTDNKNAEKQFMTMSKAGEPTKRRGNYNWRRKRGARGAKGASQKKETLLLISVPNYLEAHERSKRLAAINKKAGDEANLYKNYTKIAKKSKSDKQAARRTASAKKSKMTSMRAAGLLGRKIAQKKGEPHTHADKHMASIVKKRLGEGSRSIRRLNKKDDQRKAAGKAISASWRERHGSKYDRMANRAAAGKKTGMGLDRNTYRSIAQSHRIAKGFASRGGLKKLKKESFADFAEGSRWKKELGVVGSRRGMGGAKTISTDDMRSKHKRLKGINQKAWSGFRGGKIKPAFQPIKRESFADYAEGSRWKKELGHRGLTQGRQYVDRYNKSNRGAASRAVDIAGEERRAAKSGEGSKARWKTYNRAGEKTHDQSSKGYHKHQAKSWLKYAKKKRTGK